MLSFVSSDQERPICSAPFQTADHWLLQPRIQLYMNRIDLTDWWGGRRVWRRLSLDALTHVETPTDSTLRLRRDGDAGTGSTAACFPLTIELNDPARWAHGIRAFRACRKETA
jgi:hypothetical protein